MLTAELEEHLDGLLLSSQLLGGGEIAVSFGDEGVRVHGVHPG